MSQSSSPKETTAFVLMLKAPTPGGVKTRLACEVGDEAALAIYRRLVEWQCQQLERMPWVDVFYAPGTPATAGAMAEWLGPRFGYIPQCEGNLGDRLQSAAQSCFKRQASQVIFLGGDCPSATQEILVKATAALQAHDVVLGPAEDGGYYFIGLSRFLPQVFDNISWGSEKVLDQTKSQIDTLRLSSFELEPASDVDTWDDWLRACQRFPELAFPLPSKPDNGGVNRVS